MTHSIKPDNDSGDQQDAARLLITSPEAAKLMTISERTLFTLRKEGDLPYVRIGRSIRYDPRDIGVWIERHKSVGGASAHNDSSAGTPPSNDDLESKRDK